MNQSAAANVTMFTTTDTEYSAVSGMNEISANAIAANGV